MSIIDQTLVLSDNQAITADAASSNVIDFLKVGTPPWWSAPRVPDRGVGFHDIPLLIQVTETFNNLTSIVLQLQVDDNAAFSSPKVVAQSATVLLADLKAGYRFKFLGEIPEGVDEQFMRLYYDITGTAPTTGKIFAAITAGIQTN